MKIAIYTRKSKYSDKSESIDSQIEYCKQVAKMRYPDIENFTTYVDEGFSGGNTERPQYQKMLLDIKRNKDIAAVICYKIDRISRSLADFTNLQQVLEKHSVHIISASEGFDTSSTWGVAVLNILMIFAQLERSNISERIRDTMLHYARQGRWTGGPTPMGFESKSIPYTDAFGQEKNMVILVSNEDEIRTIKTIYGKYAELQSLSAVETYLVQNDIKTRKGFYYSMATIRDILINPVYAVADKDLYQFFVEKNAQICNDETAFDGSSSVLSYNREDRKNLVKRPINEWMIAVSKHSGIVSGKEWVKAQRILAVNSEKKPRLGTAQYGIFSGMIKCMDCGSTMRIKNGRVSAKDERQEFYYVCNLKETSKLAKCTIKNISGHTMEPIILNKIAEYAKNTELLNELARKNKIRLSSDTVEKKLALERMRSELTNKEAAIKNLVMQVSQTGNMAAGRYLLEQIDEIDKTVSDLKHRIAIIEVELSEEKSKELDLLSLKAALEKFEEIESAKDTRDKRKLLKMLIEKMEWDGRTMSVFFKTGDVINFNKLTEGGDFHLSEMQTFNSHGKSHGPHRRIEIPL